VKNTKLKEFLLAVRRLEREHGLYLRTSEWMAWEETEPDLDEGVFSATCSHEDTAELQRIAEETGL
jgi:hypothetical protein